AGPVLTYIADLRGVALDISGGDLIAEGIPASPALGAALEDTLRAKLDGDIGGREQELAHALRVARGEAE
ncbi:MAG: hypothetical protein H0V29_01470, partial [Thermoleophilaceae bacterium]|nr:hypothetical protein [Thermoleophilaceae bacterium]